MSEMYEDFKSVIDMAKAEGKERIAIELQGTPDPDAMASGLFVHEVARDAGLDSILTHSNSISHPQNLRMRHAFKLPMHQYGDAEPEGFDGFIFVDHSGGTSRWYQEGRISPESLLAVVDHHDLDMFPPDARFVDRRPVGSTSAIFGEYFAAALGAGHIEENQFERIATSLLMGIRSDTMGLLRNVAVLDSDMHRVLLPYADMDLVRRLEDVPWSSRWMDLYGEAIRNRVREDGITAAYAGRINPEEHDVLAMIGDRLRSEEHTDTVYVFGLRDDIVDVSVRTNDPTYNWGRFREMFPEGSGGGKEGSGGAQIPNPVNGTLLKDADPASVDQAVQQAMEKRIFGRILSIDENA